MRRKKAVIAVIAITALLVLVGIVLLMMGGNVANSQKIAVSNVSLDLGVQSAAVNYGVTPPSVNYTVENLNNIEVATVSVSIDGTNHAQTSLSVPPGHSVSTTTFLSDAVLSRSTNYNIEFVFTFTDGTSETYSTSCTTP
jgi:hypothetical protein